MPPMSAVEPSSPPVKAGTSAWWREREERLDRRRPRADGLTIERIVEEAVALVDAEGLEALTVRGLAARFGTGSATLYRHVASRDELLVLIVDHVLGEVVEPALDLAARARVSALATELRRVLLRHPNLIPSLPAAPLLGPNAIRGSSLALGSLIEAGFPAPLAVPAYLALLDYVLGSVFFDSGRLGRHGRPDIDDGALALRLELSDVTSDDVFALGLRTFLHGLEADAAGAIDASSDR
jgi:AcrR family transcriptional regulator